MVLTLATLLITNCESIDKTAQTRCSALVRHNFENFLNKTRLKQIELWLKGKKLKIIKAEGKSSTYLNQDIESYLVYLLARWFDKSDIPLLCDLS